ncbi:MAG: hypothetical protein ACLP7Q_01890 [Isosphaeraceae bacterium]
MLARRLTGPGLLLFGLACCFFPVDSLRAQAQGQDHDLAFGAALGQPRGLPNLPPQGAWGEVINVTSRWIVIQNHSGQQFPVAVDDIQEFLIRWPYNLASTTEQSWVEAIGQTPGSNVVQVNHVDVFEGTDRSLVRPTYNSKLPNNMVVTTVDPGFNRYMNAWDYGGQNMLYGWAYPVPANMNGIPSRLHVVGNVLDRDPPGQLIRINLPGNNFATIVPDSSGQMTVSQVTRGSSNFVRKGDRAFLMPLQTAPRGLILSQLVLYKQVPRAQFNPNR